MVAGIIPARAGVTKKEITNGNQDADHPRSRGVYRSPTRRDTPAAGSSPLARGLRLMKQLARLDRRIIPARAGFTDPACRAGRCRGDHPRSRGVYPPTLYLGGWGAGSSPLARGLRGGSGEGGEGVGIIPARAGFTIGGLEERLDDADHPRSRGVYRRQYSLPVPGAGSSPLARGLPTCTRRGAPTTGIIPARAGFTGGYLQGGVGGSDHPRSRGVYVVEQARMAYLAGSSPLARGLLWDAAADAERRRIIPARAGFTRNCRWTPSPSGDHPRSRGVYDQ